MYGLSSVSRNRRGKSRRRDTRNSQTLAIFQAAHNSLAVLHVEQELDESLAAALILRLFRSPSSSGKTNQTSRAER